MRSHGKKQEDATFQEHSLIMLLAPMVKHQNKICLSSARLLHEQGNMFERIVSLSQLMRLNGLKFKNYV